MDFPVRVVTDAASIHPKSSTQEAVYSRSMCLTPLRLSSLDLGSMPLINSVIAFYPIFNL